MKKVKILVLFLFLIQMFLGVSSIVMADSSDSDITNTSRFSAMFDRLYSEERINITVYSGNEDVTDSFVQDTLDYYLENDINSIYEYMIDNSIVISEGTPSISRFGRHNNRAIFTSVYTSSTRYAVVTGTSPFNPNVGISLPIIYTVSVTVPYDFNTGLVTGSLRNPVIRISSTDGVADSWSTYGVMCSKSITNGGYSVYYSNISFIVQANVEWVWQTYNRYYDNLSFTFTPAA